MAVYDQMMHPIVLIMFSLMYGCVIFGAIKFVSEHIPHKDKNDIDEEVRERVTETYRRSEELCNRVDIILRNIGGDRCDDDNSNDSSDNVRNRTDIKPIQHYPIWDVLPKKERLG